MRYLLLIYQDERSRSASDREACYVESAQVAQELQADGKYLACAPLHPTSAATTVRVRQGKSLVTDGPFAETREQLGGFFLIDAENLDEALQIAARLPPARNGSIEVRPVLEVGNLPEERKSEESRERSPQLA